MTPDDTSASWPCARRGGALWADVVEPAAEQGLVALHGSSPDVGVVGFCLGGGIGWYARSHRLAANSVTAVEIVTADGRLLRADHETEPDLFWGVRGGGGSFGVVTAIELELFPTPDLYAGALFWPADRAADVLAAWREWIETVPDEVTSVGRVLDTLPGEAIDAFVSAAVPPLLSVELRHLGGALAEPSAGQGAVGVVDAGFLMFTVGLTMMPGSDAAVGEAVDRVKAALAPWESTRTYLGFAERPVDPARFYTAETYGRLRSVKATYDPTELFLSNHPIPLAGQASLTP